MKTAAHVVLSLASLAVAIAPGALSAQSRVDMRREAAPDGLVEIDNPAGSIRVIGWSRKEVAVTGQLGRHASGLDFESTGHRTRIDVETEGNPHSVVSHLEVHVPAGSRIEIDSFGGSIQVTDVTGTVRAETVNGSISIVGQPREVEAESVNGSVEVSGASVRTRAETVNGAVTIRRAKGELEASTVNGRLLAEGSDFERAHLEAVAGSVTFDATFRPRAIVDIETVSGSVTVSMPADASADFTLETFSGGIDSDFGGTVRRGHHTPRQELQFSVGGGGGATITVHTLSGAISLRKK